MSEQKGDDNEKVIVDRFETYLDKTLPILEFYKKQKLLTNIVIEDYTVSFK